MTERRCLCCFGEGAKYEGPVGAAEESIKRVDCWCIVGPWLKV